MKTLQRTINEAFSELKIFRLLETSCILDFYGNGEISAQVRLEQLIKLQNHQLILSQTAALLSSFVPESLHFDCKYFQMIL